jgi:hypothetical protein
VVAVTESSLVADANTVIADNQNKSSSCDQSQFLEESAEGKNYPVVDAHTAVAVINNNSTFPDESQFLKASTSAVKLTVLDANTVVVNDQNTSTYWDKSQYMESSTSSAGKEATCLEADTEPDIDTRLDVNTVMHGIIACIAEEATTSLESGAGDVVVDVNAGIIACIAEEATTSLESGAGDVVVDVNAIIRDVISSANNEALTSHQSEANKACAVEMETVCMPHKTANKSYTAKMLGTMGKLNARNMDSRAEFAETLNYDDDDSLLDPDFDIEKALEDLGNSSDDDECEVFHKQRSSHNAHPNAMQKCTQPKLKSGAHCKKRSQQQVSVSVTTAKSEGQRRPEHTANSSDTSENLNSVETGSTKCVKGVDVPPKAYEDSSDDE